MQLMGEYVEKLQAMVGEGKASNIIRNAFFSITVGANDFLSNYFLPLTNPRMIEFTIPEFQDFLIYKLNEQIKVKVYKDSFGYFMLRFAIWLIMLTWIIIFSLDYNLFHVVNELIGNVWIWSTQCIDCRIRSNWMHASCYQPTFPW